jgi:hypothetical protein
MNWEDVTVPHSYWQKVTVPAGSIDVADTITDASELNGLVMAGSYIRPFTVEFMLTYNF